MAWAQVMPVSDGTATGGGPREGTTESFEPCLSDLARLGTVSGTMTTRCRR